MDSWQKDEAGRVVMHPLASDELVVSTAEVPRVSVRLNFVKGGAPAQLSGTTQLICSPVRARELARALESAAQQLLALSI